MNSSATAGLTHIKYLLDTWMPISLWHSWSQQGRLAASKVLGIEVEGIIPTTNHLEAFNGVLKRKHIRQWQHAGKRLRIDLLVFLLITKILPGIFAHRTAQGQYKSWLKMRFSSQALSIDFDADSRPLGVVSTAIPTQVTAPMTNISPPIAWWDAGAELKSLPEILYILEHNRLDIVRSTDDYTIMATCASRISDIRDSGYKRYNLWIATYGLASCSCGAFQSGQGACKHLWALRHQTEVLIQQHKIQHSMQFENFIFPTSISDAMRIHQQFYPAQAPSSISGTSSAGELLTLLPLDSSLSYISRRVNSWIVGAADEDGSDCEDNVSDFSLQGSDMEDDVSDGSCLSFSMCFVLTLMHKLNSLIMQWYKMTDLQYNYMTESNMPLNLFCHNYMDWPVYWKTWSTTIYLFKNPKDYWNSIN